MYSKPMHAVFVDSEIVALPAEVIKSHTHGTVVTGPLTVNDRRSGQLLWLCNSL